MSITFCQSFKQPGQLLVATSATGLTPSRLFYVTDCPTCLRFLVDTGAEVSVIPLSHAKRAHRQDHFSLQAVNNTTIATYGTCSLTVNLGLRRAFRWAFIIADVKKPILGADFLPNFGLTADVRHNRLLDATTQLKVQGIVSHTPSPSPSVRPLEPELDLSSLTSPLSHKHVSRIIQSRTR